MFIIIIAKSKMAEIPGIHCWGEIDKKNYIQFIWLETM